MKLTDKYWTHKCQFEKLSEDFMRQNADKINWVVVSEHQKLSEKFIREFATQLSWRRIICFQKLSTNFIREFKDYVDWDSLSIFGCNLIGDEKFLLEFKDDVNWYFVMTRHKVTKKIKERFSKSDFKS